MFSLPLSACFLNIEHQNVYNSHLKSEILNNKYEFLDIYLTCILRNFANIYFYVTYDNFFFNSINF